MEHAQSITFMTSEWRSIKVHAWESASVNEDTVRVQEGVHP